MAKKIGEKYFLEPGDLVTVHSGTLEFIGDSDNYKLSDLSDASLRFWIEEDEADYEITYARDLPKDDENYGKPYFEK
jgi:hypothetical protein